MLTAVLTGAGLVLAYEVLRIFRRIIPHRLWVIQLEDLLFWIAAGIFIFVQMFRTSYGAVRWYFVCGGVAGAAVCIKIVGVLNKYVKKILKHLKKNGKGTKIDTSE